MHLSRKKIDQIEIAHFERYEELEQAINDIDTKTFVISKKQDKEMKTINNEISNIRREKRGEIDQPDWHSDSNIRKDRERETPEKMLKVIKTYMLHKKIAKEETLLLLENSQKGRRPNGLQ